MGLLSRQTSKASRTGPVTDCQGCSSLQRKIPPDPCHLGDWPSHPMVPGTLKQVYLCPVKHAKRHPAECNRCGIFPHVICCKKLAKYVANVRPMFILLFCFTTSRGIFGQDLGCCKDEVDQLHLFLSTS